MMAAVSPQRETLTSELASAVAEHPAPVAEDKSAEAVDVNHVEVPANSETSSKAATVVPQIPAAEAEEYADVIAAAEPKEYADEVAASEPKEYADAVATSEPKEYADVVATSEPNEYADVVEEVEEVEESSGLVVPHSSAPPAAPAEVDRGSEGADVSMDIESDDDGPPAQPREPSVPPISQDVTSAQVTDQQAAQTYSYEQYYAAQQSMLAAQHHAYAAAYAMGAMAHAPADASAPSGEHHLVAPTAEVASAGKPIANGDNAGDQGKARRPADSGPPVGHPLWEEQQRMLAAQQAKDAPPKQQPADVAIPTSFGGRGAAAGEGRNRGGRRGGARQSPEVPAPAPATRQADPSAAAEPGTAIRLSDEEVAALVATAQAATNGPMDPHLFSKKYAVSFSAPPATISRLPPDSRLFIGNLASERTNKFEIAAIFAPYGTIVEILLKSSFGFVQYTHPMACQEAIRCENGRLVGGMYLDLKVSRDKAFVRKEQERALDGRGDRFNSDARDRDRNRDRDREFFRDRDRDRGRDRDRDRDRERSRERSRDRDDRRRRSVSPGGPAGRKSRWGADPPRQSRPGGTFGVGATVPVPTPISLSQLQEQRGASGVQALFSNMLPGNSSSPNVGAAVSAGSGHAPLPVGHAQQTVNLSALNPADFPLPRRFGSAVPDCQLIIIGDVGRNLLQRVDNVMRTGAVSVDRLILTPKLSLRNVVHQMMYEGVCAVIFVERRHEKLGQISLHVFSPGGGVTEYDNISPEVGCRLILREKASRGTQQPPQPQPYGQSNHFGQQQTPQNLASFASLLPNQSQMQPQLQPTQPQNMLGLLTTLAGAGGVDTAQLLTLMTALQQQQQQQQQQQHQQQQQQQHQQAPTVANPLAQYLSAQANQISQPTAAPTATGLAGLQAVLGQLGNVGGQQNRLASGLAGLGQVGIPQPQAPAQVPSAPQVGGTSQLSGLQSILAAFGQQPQTQTQQNSAQAPAPSGLSGLGGLSGLSGLGGMAALAPNSAATTSSASGTGSEAVGDILNRLKQLETLQKLQSQLGHRSQ